MVLSANDIGLIVGPCVLFSPKLLRGGNRNKVQIPLCWHRLRWKFGQIKYWCSHNPIFYIDSQLKVAHFNLWRKKLPWNRCFSIQFYLVPEVNFDFSPGKHLKIRIILCFKLRNIYRDNPLSIVSHINFFPLPDKFFQAEKLFLCWGEMRNNVYRGLWK